VIKATFFVRANAQINALAAGPLVAEIAQKARPTVSMPWCRSARWMPGRTGAQFGPHPGDRRRAVGHAPRRATEQQISAWLLMRPRVFPMRKRIFTPGGFGFVVGIRAIEIPLLDNTQNRAAMRELCKCRGISLKGTMPKSSCRWA
jgi:hypothetical protein